jgi:hypothetical protein
MYPYSVSKRSPMITTKIQNYYTSLIFIRPLHQKKVQSHAKSHSPYPPPNETHTNDIFRHVVPKRNTERGGRVCRKQTERIVEKG